MKSRLLMAALSADVYSPAQDTCPAGGNRAQHLALCLGQRMLLLEGITVGTRNPTYSEPRLRSSRMGEALLVAAQGYPRAAPLRVPIKSSGLLTAATCFLLTYV